MDGKNTGRMGFSHAAEDSAENMEQWKNAR